MRTTLLHGSCDAGRQRLMLVASSRRVFDSPPFPTIFPSLVPLSDTLAIQRDYYHHDKATSIRAKLFHSSTEAVTKIKFKVYPHLLPR